MHTTLHLIYAGIRTVFTKCYQIHIFPTCVSLRLIKSFMFDIRNITVNSLNNIEFIPLYPYRLHMLALAKS